MAITLQSGQRWGADTGEGSDGGDEMGEQCNHCKDWLWDISFSSLGGSPSGDWVSEEDRALQNYHVRTTNSLPGLSQRYLEPCTG